MIFFLMYLHSSKRVRILKVFDSSQSLRFELMAKLGNDFLKIEGFR